MVLSNAERQRRYKERLKAAAHGVSPEMIQQARKALYHLLCKQDSDEPDWEGFVEASRKKRGLQYWVDMLPDDVRPDAYDWVEDEQDRALLERVAAVVAAIVKPPA